MTTSPTTFEVRVRSALLDLIYAQWSELGVPFHPALPPLGLEVIDPEALLWTSFEFSDEEPRLAEGVRSWFAENRTRVIRQRLVRFAAASEARRDRWHALEATNRATSLRSNGKRIGQRSSAASALLLQARDVLGNDCRSFLLVYLIGSPRGLRLRDVTQWTGYSYRTVSETAASWNRAGIVRVHHGHCILVDPAQWCALLRCQSDEVVTVNWTAAYQASIELLHTLSKARVHGFDINHTLIASAIASTDSALAAAAAGMELSRTPGLALLRAALASEHAASRA